MGVYARPETHIGQDKVLPRISGLQAVGNVVAVGPAGDRSLVGKKVVAILVFPPEDNAQFVTARADRTVCIPQDADDVMFAAMPTQGMTAWLMLNSSTQLHPGERVLIHGAGGGVGSMAVQIGTG